MDRLSYRKRIKTIVHNKHVIFSLLFFFVTLESNAQQNIGNYTGNFEKKNHAIAFTTTNGKVKLNFYTPKVFRVRMLQSDIKHSYQGKEWMLAPSQKGTISLQIDSTQHLLKIKTSQLKIVINKSPVTIDIYNTKGVLLSAESKSNGYTRYGDTVSVKKRLGPDEHFFGFGERMDFLDRRGKKVSLNVGRGSAHGHLKGAYNTLKANYSPIPFFMSTKGYGTFLHTRYKSLWDMGSSQPNTLSFSAINGEMDYYFIYGPDFPSILYHYTSLTGRSPLLPKYALGLNFGTYSGGTWGHEDHASPAYVIALVKKFRAMGIPIDILFLDSTWRLFEEGGHGATTFEWRSTFADPKQMFDSLYAFHLHAVGLHIRPRLDNGTQYHLLKKAQEAGMTYSKPGEPGGFPNYFDSTAVNWWWNHAAKKVASQGAKFFKTDEGSAFGRKANESSKMKPTDSMAISLHNIFPLAYTQAAFKKFQDYNGGRGLNQTREGYAGIQRYPYIFAGDWPSEWQFFEPIIKAGLNIGLSGVGYWTHCMGGFEGKADPELYIRWCQFGMFSPIAMAFGMDHPGYKEPWNYGEKGLANFKKYDSLRYTLLPYIYSTAYELYKTGMPIMRALVLNYQNDPNVYNITNQYMFGDNMMVCPVTEKGARSRVVYLPEGSWYNYWTGERFEGKRYLTVLAPLMQIPIFIKAGALIPTQREMQYVGQKPLDTIVWDIYPGTNSRYTLYDDDGKSMKYQNGNFALTKISCEKIKSNINIHISKPKGKFELPPRGYILKVHTDRKPTSVRINHTDLALTHAQNTGWSYNKEKKILSLYPKKESKKNIQITIQK